VRLCLGLIESFLKSETCIKEKLLFAISTGLQIEFSSIQDFGNREAAATQIFFASSTGLL
jgi:hypothetical protein